MTAGFIELSRQERAAAVETMVSTGIFAAVLRRHIPAETMGLKGRTPLLDREVEETIEPRSRLATAEAGNSAAHRPLAGAQHRAAMAAANTVAAMAKAGAINRR